MQISYFDKECDVNFYYSFTIFLQQKTIEYKEDKKKKSRLLEQQRKIVIHSFIINLLSNYYLPEVTDNMLIFLILKKIP